MGVGRHTESELNGKKVLDLDSVPSYTHGDGHMLCAGNTTHWTNAAALRDWVNKVCCCTCIVYAFISVCQIRFLHISCGALLQIVWPLHQQRSTDPWKEGSIIHIDAYPVHTTEAFRDWLQAEYKGSAPSLRPS